MQETSKSWFEVGSTQVHPAFFKCASKIVALLDKRAGTVIESAQSLLFDLAQQANSNVEQTKFFEGMQTLQRQGQSLHQTFIKLIGKHPRDFCHHPGTIWRDHAQANKQLPNELRVLDDRDLAETLALESMIDTAEIRYARHLHALNIRFSSVVKAEKPLTNRVNPIAPKRICEAFRDAMIEFEAELEVNLSLYKEFDKELVRKLGEIYKEVNTSLAEAGIVPEIKFQPNARTGEAETDKEEEFDLFETVESNQDHEYESEKSAQEARVEQLETQLFQSINELIAQKRAINPHTMSAAMQSAHPVEQPALLDALHSLQSQIAQSSNQQIQTEHLKEQILQSIQQYSPADQPARIRNLHENTIDAVGMMFDFIGADKQLPSPFQLALSRLQIPYLKASLNNPRMFTSRRGAARRLVDSIAKAGSSWNQESDKGQAVLKKANEIIDRALNEYQDDDSIFETLLNEFESFQTRQERRSAVREKREKEAAAGAEKLQMARTDVGRIISNQIQGQAIPSLVKNLLQKPWAHVMVLTLLRHGRRSKQWKSAMSTAKELVWSVSFDRSAKNVTRLRTRLPVLAKTLSLGLKQVGYQDSEIRKILFNLKQIYVSLVKKTGDDRIIIEASESGLVIRGDDITEHAELESTPEIHNEQDLKELLDNIKGWHEGQWVMFHRDEKEPVRAKLSWISPITGRYLFVDQRGMKAKEKTLQELAEDLLGEKVSVMDREELVNRALTAVRDGLQSELEQQNQDEQSAQDDQTETSFD